MDVTIERQRVVGITIKSDDDFLFTAHALNAALVYAQNQVFKEEVDPSYQHQVPYFALLDTLRGWQTQYDNCDRLSREITMAGMKGNAYTKTGHEARFCYEAIMVGIHRLNRTRKPDQRIQPEGYVRYIDPAGNTI